MTRPTKLSSDPRHPFVILSEVLVRARLPGQTSEPDGRRPAIRDLHIGDLQGLLTLAAKHHVVIRALEPLRAEMLAAGENPGTAELYRAVESERARIHSALLGLKPACDVLCNAGCDIVVIKSLDHWPDLGGDLDLFTNARADDVTHVMTEICGAQLEPRSWGDRLANKWNFKLPTLSELVEIHIGRLGQTGEHLDLGRSLVAQAISAQFGSHRFVVPAPEHRIILATLQRMYRHFYLRLCDIVNTAELVECGSIDYEVLESVARQAGIWQGVASYLAVVSDYIKRFRGYGLQVPEPVRMASRLEGDRVYFGRDFLRIPILPESARLYCEEMKRFLRRGDVPGMLRLSVLPCLATAAAVGQKLTGSDKGVW